MEYMITMVIAPITVIAIAYVVKVIADIYLRYQEARYNKKAMKTVLGGFSHLMESYDKLMKKFMEDT